MRRTIITSLLLSALASAAFAQDAAAPVPAPATAPAPPAAEEAKPEPEKSAAAPDVSALQKDLAAVLDELTQARARATLLVKTLFRTRVEVSVARRADDQRMTRIVLRFDGVPVHDSDGTAVAREEARLFDGYAAPGLHELTVLVSEQATHDSKYSYTREERFRFEVKKDTNTKIRVLLRDRSDMAEELAEDDEGKYDVSTTVRIERVNANED